MSKKSKNIINFNKEQQVEDWLRGNRKDFPLFKDIEPVAMPESEYCNCDNPSKDNSRYILRIEKLADDDGSGRFCLSCKKEFTRGSWEAYIRQEGVLGYDEYNEDSYNG